MYVDLCERVVATVAGGASVHWVAARFALEGHLAPKSTHGNDRLPANEAPAGLILSFDEATSDRFLHELRAALADQGVQTSGSGLSRFIARHGIARKEGGGAVSRSGWT
ncbi:hypothetical protein CRT23_26565 [Methylobacterium sp. V23]|nr:hypothetical protein CRT23_26565 [Methylobacterium sp. V23]